MTRSNRDRDIEAQRARLLDTLEAYDSARLCHYGTADHMRLLSRADGLLRAALPAIRQAAKDSNHERE